MLKAIPTFRSALCRLHATPYTGQSPRRNHPIKHVVAARLSHCTLHTSYATWHALHSRIHTLNYTLHSALHTTHSSHYTPFTLHYTLFTLHTFHSTVHTFHSTLSTFHSTLHCLHFTLHTLHSPRQTPHFTLSYWKMHSTLPSTTLYYKACTEYLPVLLCTISLAQSTFQYYLVLQSLHKILPNRKWVWNNSETSLKQAWKLRRTTKFAQRTSQYYFVLQALHKVPRSSQYYFVLQMHLPVLLSLYYKACTKYFPTILYYKLERSLKNDDFYTIRW